MKNYRIYLAGVAVAMCVIQPAARGAIITSDPSLPATSGAYIESGPVVFNGPGLSIILADVVHTPQAGTINTTPSGADEFETFNSILTGLVTVNGNPAVPFQLSGPVQTEVFGKIGNTTGTFNTQMVSLDLTGAVGGHSIEIRLDPSQASTGQTTITSVPGNLFQISSFFDVFTELSIDNGPFIPQANGPTHVDLESSVPEPTTIIAGLSLLLPFGASALRKLRKARPA